MQAQQAAAANASAAAAAGAPSGGGDFTPINGVTLEQYAAICKGLGAGAADPAQAHAAAGAAGGIRPGVRARRARSARRAGTECGRA